MARLPAHHPPEDLLLAYAQGTCSEGESLLMAAHLTLCPTCRAEVGALEAVGGQLLAEEEAAAMPEGLLEATLSRLDQPTRAPVPVPPPDLAGLERVPRPILARIPAGARWRRILPGVEVIDLGVRQGTEEVRLARLAPGFTLPHHTHEGLERTLVFDGIFADDTLRLEDGDVGVRDDTVRHTQRVIGPTPCVCLVVNDAPLVPLTWLGRFARRLGLA